MCHRSERGNLEYRNRAVRPTTQRQVFEDTNTNLMFLQVLDLKMETFSKFREGIDFT